MKVIISILIVFINILILNHILIFNNIVFFRNVQSEFHEFIKMF